MAWIHLQVDALALVRPDPADLWAFWVLAGLWVVILGFVWGMVRWLRGPTDEREHRGL